MSAGGPRDAEAAAEGLPLAAAVVPGWVERHWNVIAPVAMLSMAMVFVAIGLSLWLTGRLDVNDVGYAGVWVISFISAASIVVPVPGLAAVCIGAAPDVGLEPLFLGVLAGSAEALGEMTGYIAGASGRGLIQKQRYYPRFQAWMDRWGGLLLFLGSTIPNPVFDFLGVAAGSSRYPIKRFLPLVFAGKTIKSTSIAYGCYYGVGVVQNLVDGWI
ncbi:MAG: VTT domain-containing protein [Dehalococcoidia bacterium]